MNTINNPKIRQLYITAKSLFMRYGIKRVTIEEICREAHVSKMTFYKHFSNKTDLVKFILEQKMSDALLKYNQIMEQDIPFPEKIKKGIQLKMEQADELSPEFFNDIYKNADPAIMEFFAGKTHENIQIVLKDYTDAQKEGEVRQDIKPEFIHYILNHMTELAKDERLMKLYNSPKELIMELTNFFFYGILPRETSGKKKGMV